MKIIFAGTGSAFTTENYHSNIVIEHDNGKRLLVDCGSDIKHSVKKLDMTHKDFDDVYISHLHGDHAAGLEWLGFMRYFDPTTSQPNVFISREFASDLWNRCLSGAMRSVQGKVTDEKDFFNIVKISKNGHFIWEGIKFQLVQTVHIMNGFNIVPSYGLLFEMNKTKVFITTDTQFAPHQIQDFYNMADIIIHDCETLPFKSGVHSHYDDLLGLAIETRKKMWLYHYQDGGHEYADAVADGFKGFAERGQVIEI